MGAAVCGLAEVAWQQAGRPALGAGKDSGMELLQACIPEGDPLQVLLEGNARFADFETRYRQSSSEADTATSIGPVLARQLATWRVLCW